MLSREPGLLKQDYRIVSVEKDTCDVLKLGPNKVPKMTAVFCCLPKVTAFIFYTHANANQKCCVPGPLPPKQNRWLVKILSSMLGNIFYLLEYWVFY